VFRRHAGRTLHMVKGRKKTLDEVLARLPPEEVAEAEREAEREILELNLRELRGLAEKTQIDLGRVLGMSQPEISRTERGSDHLLSTLKRYVEALGGEVEVVAHVAGRTVKLRGV